MPSSALRTFTEPDAYFGGIRNLQVDGVVTRSGKFHAEATRIDLHRVWMHRFDEKLPRIMRVTPSGARSLILFPTDPDHVMLANGVEASQQQIVMFGLRWPYYLRSSEGTGWATISVTPEDLAIASNAIIGRELSPPNFMRRLKPPPSSLSRLIQLHKAASHLAKTTPDILAKPEVARSLEQALLEAFILCVGGAPSELERKVHRQRAKVMCRLEETLRTHSEEALYMADLCEAAGASYWTLRDCCQEYLGMGPKRYLWMRRMNLARRALHSASGNSTTVTEVATNYGFWELGRFSVAYRTLFGESPSVALRRPPDTADTATQASESFPNYLKSA
jgi:AraC-like DNA-binding protein